MNFSTAAISTSSFRVLSASLLALAAFGAQAAVPDQDEMGPVRQACPQIDSKLQQALDRGVSKLSNNSVARVEFTVKGTQITKVRQSNVPSELRPHVFQAMRQLNCQSDGEQTLAFNLRLLPR